MNTDYLLLAEKLVAYSLKISPGEKVALSAVDTPEEFLISLIRVIRKYEAEPFITLQSSRINRELVIDINDSHAQNMAEIELETLKQMDAFIAVRGASNISEMSDVPSDKMDIFMKKFRPVQDYRVNKTRWVILRWPTPSMAQLAQMSTESFEQFFFETTLFPYDRMLPGMEILKALMEKTDRVCIKGENTHLEFSIANIPAVLCCGEFNIPDGEVFTAPVKNSVEGFISFNTPTIYRGIAFDNICLKFQQGRIVEATANNTRAINEILNSDEGSRFIGEFALGVHPLILQPMRDILFDEKIAGSFHFTPGQAYEIADNGNRSIVHWDMVSIQRPEYGGGEIFFDNQLIRKDGLFVTPELQILNPSYLTRDKQ